MASGARYERGGFGGAIDGGLQGNDPGDRVERTGERLSSGPYLAAPCKLLGTHKEALEGLPPTNRFLVVSNIRPDDPSAVVQGNERVVRPRLADAKFFFDQDRRRSLAERVPGLASWLKSAALDQKVTVVRARVESDR